MNKGDSNMKNDFTIQAPTEEEMNFISKEMKEYDAKNIPLKREQVVESICKVIKDAQGKVIAGLVGYMYHNFKSFYIDLLWVKEEFRRCNYGTILLEAAEKEAFEKGANFVHLDTLGFQAKGFYAKKGYGMFAVLEECALNNKMYYMKKIFNTMNVSLKTNNAVQSGTDEDSQYINDRIVEFNSQQVPFTNEPAFDYIDKVIKGTDGKVIAGILVSIFPWKDLFIHGIWAIEESREEELKTKLLNEVERELQERGGHLSMLEIFDPKTRDFYSRNGYEVYGVIEEYPAECKKYYMKKVFNAI